MSVVGVRITTCIRCLLETAYLWHPFMRRNNPERVPCSNVDEYTESLHKQLG